MKGTNNYFGEIKRGVKLRKEDDGNIDVLYQEELEDLKRRLTFKYKHGFKLTSLSDRYKIAKKEATVPWPGIAHLSLVSKIKAKCCKGT